jgi:CRISPR-associated protein Cmr1
MKPQKLTAKFEVITPVFCAGAEQNGPAEIRPFSLRGALRWWYRALDGEYRAHESDFFGAAGTTIKSSPVTLRVHPWVTGQKEYRNELQPQNALSRGEAYLGYTLYLGQNRRKAVPPQIPVEIQLLQLRVGEDVRRAWAASLWLFGHLGGLGTRSRRGFGTMALTSWSGWDECKDLPPAHGANSPAEWKEKFEAGFATIRNWFPEGPRNAQHHHLGKTLDVYIWKNGARSWTEALNEAGNVFREFRMQRNNHRPELLAGFGLPIKFRNHQARRATLVGRDRAPSRLQFRVVRIGQKFHPMVWRCEGPLGPGEVRIEYSGTYNSDRLDDRLIDGFVKHIQQFCRT